MTVDLALFDIDGTLTVSNKIDTDCFVHAFRDAFGIADMAVGWQHYEHSTDRGITAEVLRRAWAREASEEELTKHRQRFLQRFEPRLPRKPENLLLGQKVERSVRTTIRCRLWASHSS